MRAGPGMNANISDLKSLSGILEGALLASLGYF